MWLKVFVLLGLCTVTGVTNSVFHPSGTVDQGLSFTLSQTVRDTLSSCNQDLLQSAEFLAKFKFRSCSGSGLFSVSDLSRIDWKIKSDLWTFSATVHAQRTSLYFFGHKSTRSRKACLITILLLISGVESNPGPSNQHVNMGLINAWSIVNTTISIFGQLRKRLFMKILRMYLSVMRLQRDIPYFTSTAGGCQGLVLLEEAVLSSYTVIVSR